MILEIFQKLSSDSRNIREFSICYLIVPNFLNARIAVNPHGILKMRFELIFPVSLLIEASSDAYINPGLFPGIGKIFSIIKYFWLFEEAYFVEYDRNIKQDKSGK